MSNKLKMLLIALSIIGIFSGCGDSTESCGCNINHPDQNHTAVLNANKFNTTTGTITEAAELNIPVTTTTMYFTTGTVLQDENTHAITKVPTLEANVDKSQTKAKTTLSLTSNGKKVIPTEPVRVLVAAPTGAKEGDTVNITLPNGTTQTGTVNADGTVSVTLAPNNFTNNPMVITVMLANGSVTPTDHSTN